MTPASDSLFVQLYDRVRRTPYDGSISAAITAHSQACGLIAYLFDTHPDRVAEAVRDDRHRHEHLLPCGHDRRISGTCNEDCKRW